MKLQLERVYLHLAELLEVALGTKVLARRISKWKGSSTEQTI
jgi:hypothetical protein